MRTYLKVALMVAVLAVPVSNAAASDTVYVPLGSAGEIVVIDSDRDVIIERIGDVPDSHGLASAPGFGYLIAGSYAESRAASDIPPKPANMSAEEHEAHHARPPDQATESETVVGYLIAIQTGGEHGLGVVGLGRDHPLGECWGCGAVALVPRDLVVRG